MITWHICVILDRWPSSHCTSEWIQNMNCTSASSSSSCAGVKHILHVWIGVPPNPDGRPFGACHILDESISRYWRRSSVHQASVDHTFRVHTVPLCYPHQMWIRREVRGVDCHTANWSQLWNLAKNTIPPPNTSNSNNRTFILLTTESIHWLCSDWAQQLTGALDEGGRGPAWLLTPYSLWNSQHWAVLVDPSALTKDQQTFPSCVLELGETPPISGTLVHWMHKKRIKICSVYDHQQPWMRHISDIPSSIITTYQLDPWVWRPNVLQGLCPGLIGRFRPPLFVQELRSQTPATPLLWRERLMQDEDAAWRCDEDVSLPNTVEVDSTRKSSP